MHSSMTPCTRIDELWPLRYAQHAMYTIDYDLTSRAQGDERSTESFGLDVGGRLMIVAADRFPALVAALADSYGAQA